MAKLTNNLANSARATSDALVRREQGHIDFLRQVALADASVSNDTPPVADALASGNTCVAKPSELTPYATEHFMSLVREAGTADWKRISWDEALTRVAKHMKADRDANFIKTNAAGVTVNRWNSTGFLMSSAASNESGYLSVKVARGLGMVAIDTQARI